MWILRHIGTLQATAEGGPMNTREEVNAATPSKRLTPRQAAEYLGVALRTLYTFPVRKFKRGRVVRYDTRDLDDFLLLNTIGPPKLRRVS